MSEIAGDYLTTEEKILEPNRKRNVSGELDVFEATRYFSDFNEPTKLECSRNQIQKQSIVTELRQNRVHPETEEKLPVKPKEATRGGGGRKLTSFLNSLLRSVGLKKSKSKSTPEVVETPRGERKRRQSCVVTMTTREEATSPIFDGSAWRLNARRRSFDEKHVQDSKESIRFCESLYSKEKVLFKDQKAKDDYVSGGRDSVSSSESDLFELDLFAKSKP
ncbi:unnamed protein product [Cochlearia groenlandica]